MSLSDELPYDIKESGELGRYIVAARDLPAGTVIVRETPVACAPADDPSLEDFGGIPMCLGCFARMNGNTQSRCSKCKWPVCGEECEKISHHANNECTFFVENKIYYKFMKENSLLNESIFVFRCLLLKKKCPTIWETIIMKFEHHTKIRRTKSFCVTKDTKVIANLKEFFQFSKEFSLDEDEVIFISGIINVNAFSTTKLEDECRRVRRRMTVAQCLYPTASLLAHSCVPNATWTVSSSPDFQMTIRTTIPLRKGDMIAIAYATREIALGTLQRLVSTEEIAHFICKCYRCSDPTECGTFVAGIKCSSCHEENNTILPVNPTEAESLWKCLGCRQTVSVERIVKLVGKIENQFENIKSLAYSRHEEVEELEKLYEKSRTGVVHENHFMLQEISLRIVSRQALNIYGLNEQEMQRFLFHCRFLLKTADVITPGVCRSRGLMQFYIAQGLSIKLRKLAVDFFDKEKISTHHKDEQENKRIILRELCHDVHNLQKESLRHFINENEDNNGRKKNIGMNQYLMCLMDEMEYSTKLLNKIN